jgi:hypothetical protein
VVSFQARANPLELSYPFPRHHCPYINSWHFVFCIEAEKDFVLSLRKNTLKKLENVMDIMPISIKDTLRKIIKTNPLLEAIFINLNTRAADKYEKKEMLDKRLSCLKRINSYAPKNYPTLLSLWKIETQCNRHHKALIWAKNATKYHPHKLKGYYLAVNTLISLKQFDEAEKIILKSLEIKPNNIISLKLGHRLATFQKNKEKALEWAKEIIYLHPKEILGYHLAANELINLELFDEADKILKQTESIDIKKAVDKTKNIDLQIKLKLGKAQNDSFEALNQIFFDLSELIEPEMLLLCFSYYIINLKKFLGLRSFRQKGLDSFCLSSRFILNKKPPYHRATSLRIINLSVKIIGRCLNCTAESVKNVFKELENWRNYINTAAIKKTKEKPDVLESLLALHTSKDATQAKGLLEKMHAIESIGTKLPVLFSTELQLLSFTAETKSIWRNSYTVTKEIRNLIKRVSALIVSNKKYGIITRIDTNNPSSKARSVDFIKAVLPPWLINGFFSKSKVLSLVILDSSNERSIFSKEMILEFEKNLQLQTDKSVDFLYLCQNEVTSNIIQRMNSKKFSSAVHNTHLYLEGITKSIPPIYLNHFNSSRYQYSALCLNNIPKAHRISTLVYLEAKGVLNLFKWSLNFSPKKPSPNIDPKHTEFSQVLKLLSKSSLSSHTCKMAYDSILSQCPKFLDLQDRNQLSSSGRGSYVNKAPFELSKDCCFFIVTESEFQNGDTLRRFTEKTVKPIALGMPFIILGQPFTLKRLQILGFKTFSDYIDESYDLIDDPIERFELVMREIIRHTGSLEKSKQLVKQTLSITQYNQKRLLQLNDGTKNKKKIDQIREIEEWKKNGKPSPPPHIIKQQALKYYADQYKLKTFVETGTYKGEMVKALMNDFDRVYSIELSRDLYKKAQNRFRKNDHVKLIHGDSGEKLKAIMQQIDQPTLFWLDGHYSSGITAKGKKDTPIMEELSNILSCRDKGHVIVIDDARMFGKNKAYPSLEELEIFINSMRINVNISIENDSIRITPSGK